MVKYKQYTFGSGDESWNELMMGKWEVHTKKLRKL